MTVIHLFASLGDKNKIAYGGGETSARRIVQVLNKMGYVVSVVSRTRPSFTSKSFYSTIYKIVSYIIDPIRWLFHLLFKKRNNAISLVICYAGLLFPFYFLVLKISKILKFKTLLYIKGAFTEEKYSSLSQFLKRTYTNGLSYSDIVMYEGLDGKNISERVRPDVQAVWFPNFIENSFMPSSVVQRTDERINLMYFGRLDPGKNIIMIIEIFELLCKNFDNLFLSIIGSGEMKYTSEVMERISSSPNRDRIERMQRIEHDELKKFLPKQHFFIFPTESEGHSNSLTEAMAYGVIPIASRRGFNATVIGDDRLIVDEMYADAYVKTISDIITKKEGSVLSQLMYERVKIHFTQEIAEKILEENISRISRKD